MHLLETLQLLDKTQVNLVSLRENIDTGTATDRCFLRRQTTLTCFGIVTIYLARHRKHIAAFTGEVLRHIHELPASMREAVGRQDLHSYSQLRHIARQRIAHLNRAGQFRPALLQHLGEVLAGVTTARKIQRNPAEDAA